MANQATLVSRFFVFFSLQARTRQMSSQPLSLLHKRHHLHSSSRVLFSPEVLVSRLQALAHGIADWAATGGAGERDGAAPAIGSPVAAANTAWAADSAGSGLPRSAKRQGVRLSFLWSPHGECGAAGSGWVTADARSAANVAATHRFADDLPALSRAAAERVKERAREIVSELLEEEALKLIYALKMTSARLLCLVVITDRLISQPQPTASASEAPASPC